VVGWIGDINLSYAVDMLKVQAIIKFLIKIRIKEEIFLVRRNDEVSIEELFRLHYLMPPTANELDESVSFTGSVEFFNPTMMLTINGW
jgi:hypothetical protein